MPQPPDDCPATSLDQALRPAWEQRDYEQVAAGVLSALGADVLAFLVDRLRTLADAQEVFGMFAEDLWRGLPSFRWEGTLRGWAFTLARNAANRYLRDPRRRRERNLPLPAPSSLAEAVVAVRSATPAFQRTQVKDGLRALRAELPEADQTLLVLRIDQRLSWDELASVLGAEADAQERQRLAVRLRQRFKRLKDELRARAQARGLLE